MRVLKVLPHILVACCLTTVSLQAAPKRYMTKAEKNRSSVDELHGLIDDVRYETANHEAELRMFEEKLNNQELALDTLWKQLSDTNLHSKEQMRDTFKNVEEKLTQLEKKTGNAISDLQKVKNHSNESADTVAHYKEKIAQLEKTIDVMESNLEHMYTAMKSMMDALQIRDVALEMQHSKASSEGMVSGTAVYRVKAGDSLEKIARRHHTTVQKLREMNRLNDANDLIIVGQSLKIPEA